MQTAAELIPNTTVTVRAREKPWVNGGLKRLIRRRNVLWRRYKRSRSDAHFNTFKIVRNQVVALNRTLRLNYYTSLGEELSSSDMPDRKWWKTVRQVTGDKVCTSIPPLIENGVSLTDQCVKAAIFNQYFTSQCTQPPRAENPLPPFEYETKARLSDMSFSIPEVKKLLKSLNVNKATGPDGISIFLLKNTADVLAKALCKLFNYSLEAGVFPSDWKTSNVVPVHKKNDAQNNNYRPVPLFCNVSKIFKRLVYNKMYSFLMENKLLSPHNSGFHSGGGTVSQLLSITHKLTAALDDGKDVSIVFLDLSKAFDKIWHKCVLFKIKRKAISGNLLKWISSYLHQRVQRVVLDGHHSETLPVDAGVP